MEPAQHSPTSSPAHNEVRLAELVEAIRDGAADAEADFHRVFYAGTCFLIRRRLGRIDADAHARKVLENVVRKIREDHSVQGRNLPGLVRQLIVKGFPVSRNRTIPKDGADHPALIFRWPPMGGHLRE